MSRAPSAPDSIRPKTGRITDVGVEGDRVPATDVEPYPVQLGSRYRDGRPGESGKEWWGTVTGFQPPGALDFHHTIDVSQLRAPVDVRIHYCFEPEVRARVGRASAAAQM